MTPDKALSSRLPLLWPLVVLLGVGVWAFAPVYVGGSYLIAGAGGLAIGVGLGFVGALRRWPWYLVWATALVAYIVLAAPLALRDDAIAGFVPSLATIAEAARGLGTSWKDLLTAEAPVVGYSTTLLVPFLATLLASLAATTIVLRGRRPAWALAPVGALTLIAVVFGTYLVSLPVVAAVAASLGGALWLAWVRRETRVLGDSQAQAGAPAWPAVAAGTAMIVVAGGAAWGVGTVAVAGESRDVLRNHVLPPFDIHDYASPLQSFRGLESDQAEPTLFTVGGLPAGARVRLATLDTYDGTVFGVGATGQAGSGTFLALSGDTGVTADGDAVEITFTAGTLGGVWLPDVGDVQSVSFSDDEHRSVYYNRATGTAVVPSMLSEGTEYTVETTWSAIPTAEELGDDTFASLAVPDATNIPSSVADAAQEAVAEAATDAERMEALAAWLRDTGYFSHGVSDSEPDSLSGHGTVRIDSLLTSEQMVGDDEQYAVALALMARSLGIPSRVVMGFYPDDAVAGSYDVTAADLHAWVEVPYESAGWVAYDAAPDEDKTIPDSEQPPRHQAHPQVLQPPPPPEEPEETPPTEAIEDEAIEGDDPLLETIVEIVRYGAVAGGVSAALALPFVAILVAKARRRRARRHATRPADAVAGAWDELADAATDTGIALIPGATRAEQGHALDYELSSSTAVALARRADAGVFGPVDWDDAQTQAFWDEVDAYIVQTRRRGGRLRALRSRLSLRSLAHRRRSARMVGGSER
ncbi:transglutaminase domain-containing protein [Demequina sp. NBRC 110054]|uniref:transglutaminase family protein n=1 Tax=Demequina sp. NBRC 110054 TaxID=1570343 RepID=UPI000A051E4B|nr:transglutaminase domain-containing protein [Demequina sp. NBRC 110054]